MAFNPPHKFMLNFLSCSMSDFEDSIAILGGGISGLCAGYALKKEGFNVTVYERNEAAGGVILSQRQNGWLVETGPNTLLAGGKKLWNFFEELNLTDRVEKAKPQTKKRFIVHNGKLHAVPSSFFGLLKTGLLSTSAKCRLLKEPFVASSNKKDETIASFIIRRFGQEPLDYGINPFVAGVYAGDPSTLSVKHTFSSLFEWEHKYGSVLKGLMKKKTKKKIAKALISFDEGLQTLPRRLSQKLNDSMRLNTEVTGISKYKLGWNIGTKNNGQIANREHSAIVSTLPSYQLPKIWSESKSSKAMKKLSSVEYVPVSTVTLGFKRKQINHPLDGFGFLVPEKENFNILGCLFSSSLFTNRAPEHHALLTCFIGGTRQSNLAGEPAEKLISIARKDLNKLLKVEGEPVFSRHSYWPQAIPQFNLGYDALLTAAGEIEKQNPGFFIGGNFVSGVSLPDCILSSLKLAEKVKTFYRKNTKDTKTF